MTKAKKRNVIVALALVALLAVGGTLAYLTAVTNTADNTFTMGKGITGTTDEPKWEATGKKDAEKFTPGKVIAKDPQITNTSDAEAGPAYVAATLTYQVKDDEGNWNNTTYANLDKFINIKHGNSLADGFNIDADTGWIMAKDNTIAYYNATLAPNSKTSAIFDAVEIDKFALTPDQVASGSGANPQFDVKKYSTDDPDGTTVAYTEYTMKDFQIVVKGYLVQSEGFSDAQTAMQTAFPEVFGTQAAPTV